MGRRSLSLSLPLLTISNRPRTSPEAELTETRCRGAPGARSILLKHLKRQIVSTQGGLRLIADLNAYHAFVATLRQPQVTSYFTSLKMVGELFLIDDPKELGALVRDTSRYEGTLSQEDLYELGPFFFFFFLEPPP